MAKITVVDFSWSKRKAFLFAVGVAAVSIVLLWGLDKWNEAWNFYEMPDWLFAPLFLTSVLIYPIVALIFSYRRLPGALHGFAYALGFGLGWYVTMEVLQTAEFGPWKGFRAGERTVLNLLTRQVRSLIVTLVACVGLCMAVWGLCRLIRGKVLVQDGTLCPKCAYSLIGNVSGVCPECGAPVPERLRSPASHGPAA